MAQKAIDFKSILPAASALALATVISVGLVYLTGRHLVPVKQGEDRHPANFGRGSADRLDPDGRFWRVHVLLR